MMLFLTLFMKMNLSFAGPLELNCQWQERQGYWAGYYRSAQMDLVIDAGTVRIYNDSYFRRRYEPCWTGGFASCYFNFGVNLEKELKIQDQAPGMMHLEQSTTYGFVSLDVTWIPSIEGVATGDSVQMILDGDDGDGVMISDERFMCKVR